MSTKSGSSCCTKPASQPQPPQPNSKPEQWQRNYLLAITALAILWWLAYRYILPF